MRIALLEDDAAQAAAVRAAVERAGHAVSLFADGDALLRALSRETFDLLLLDWMVPGKSGVEVVRWARGHLPPALPVLMLTSRSTGEDIIEGLEAGADDYVPKPVDPAVLVARITALLRRAYPASDAPVVEIAGFSFEKATGVVTRGGERIELTAKECELALLLFRNIGRPLSRAYLLETVWNRNPDVPTRTLDAHISRVRTKLGLRPDHGFQLGPVYSFGYRLEQLGAEN
jgi:DNA-binding response OmpR family regulator